MQATTQNKVGDYTGIFQSPYTTGGGAGAGGGLVSMAEAFASSVGSIVEMASTTGAGAVYGIEAMTIGEALASGAVAGDARCSTAYPSLMFQCQQQLDTRIIERCAYKLRARMQGDGKVIEDDSFRDAIQHAAYTVTLWRSGVTTARGEDGADKLTPDGGEREKHVARVAWRALVASLSNDGLGNTVPLVGGAEDDWLCAQALPSESRAERLARHWISRHTHTRQARLVRRLSHVSGGRGRRAQAIEKVQNALGLILGGDSLDAAAAAAGFKPRGRHPAGDSLLRAANRLGLIPPGFSIPRRGR